MKNNRNMRIIPALNVMRFECRCGEDIEVEIGTASERSRPVCECGQAWIVSYTINGPKIEIDV